MTPTPRCLTDALLDSSHVERVIDALRSGTPKDLDLFPSRFLGEVDILRELNDAKTCYDSGDFETCEGRLLTLQNHAQRLSRQNDLTLVCIFICLGTVKQRQRRPHEAFGYLIHALSILEDSAGSLNILAVMVLHSIYQNELERGEPDRAAEVRLLFRLVKSRIEGCRLTSFSIWKHLESLLRQGEIVEPPSPELTVNAAKRFRAAVHSHGRMSEEAGNAAISLGAALFRAERLLQARKYLELGLSICRRRRALNLRRTADVYDLLVTICESLHDYRGSSEYRLRSRLLRRVWETHSIAKRRVSSS